MSKWKVMDPWTGAVKFVVEQLVEIPLTPIVLFIALVVAVCAFPYVVLFIYLGLLLSCFLVIFWKPLRGILGFGIPVLCLYIIYVHNVKNGSGQLDTIGVACAVMIWLAPMMAITQKPLYVLAAFASAGLAAAGFFGGLPLLLPYEPLIESVPFPQAILVFLAILVFVSIELALLIGLPIYLIIEAFSGDVKKKEKYKKTY